MDDERISEPILRMAERSVEGWGPCICGAKGECPPCKAAEFAQEVVMKVWDRFLFLVSVDVFGEKEVISQGKKIKNFLGSVERHQQLFERAIREDWGPNLEKKSHGKS